MFRIALIVEICKINKVKADLFHDLLSRLEENNYNFCYMEKDKERKRNPG